MTIIDADALHRTVKLELDEGRATSFDEAKAIAAGYVLQIDVGPEAATSATAQAALLTAVNTAARAFLGGVFVRTTTDTVLATRWAAGQTLADAVRTYGGRMVTNLSDDRPTLVIGTPRTPVGRPLLHLTWNGWAGAAVPSDAQRLPEHQEFPLAGALAAGLGVSELFQHARGSTRAGWRAAGVSLWRPDGDWRDPAAHGPTCPYLPQQLLIAGLGHLGQATCWTLGLLPYADAMPAITLWDFDVVIEANHSTGLLTTPSDIDRRKTRVGAQRLERIGFTTALVERRVDDNTRRTADEPPWALAGFDTPEPRRALAKAGFTKVVDLGLGADTRTYLEILIHTFPSELSPDQAWPDHLKAFEHGLPSGYENEVSRAVQNGISEGTARCGAIQAAGRSVAAAFVGATASTLAIAEILREMLGGAATSIPSYEVIALPLANPEHIEAAHNHGPLVTDHPGFLPAST